MSVGETHRTFAHVNDLVEWQVAEITRLTAALEEAEKRGKALEAALKRQHRAWGNVVEFGLVDEQHKISAVNLRDEIASLLEPKT